MLLRKKCKKLFVFMLNNEEKAVPRKFRLQPPVSTTPQLELSDQNKLMNGSKTGFLNRGVIISFGLKRLFFWG